MYSRILTFLFVALMFGNFFGSCKCNGDTSNETIAVDSLGLDPTKPQPVLAVPPPSPVVEEIVQRQKNNSPFKGLGCCSEPAPKNSEPCCCNEVLEKYRQMKAAKDKNLGELKMKDPILAICRGKLNKEFEAIDYPPPPPGTKEIDEDF